MFSKSKITLAVAIVLSAASAAMSAPKHPVAPVHHGDQLAVKRYVSPPASVAVQKSASFLRRVQHADF